MKASGILIVTWLATAGWLAAGVILAEDRPLDFIHALQERGYDDVAVDYLQMLRQQPQMPAAVRDVWDLEMSRSLRGAAKAAFDARDSDRLLAEAQKHLHKFLKEKPDHPEAAAALASWGNLSIDRALQHLRASRSITEKQQQAAQLAEARAALEEAQPRLKQAVDKYQARLAALPPAPLRATSKAELAAAAQREQLQASWLDARFQAALVHYYLAQTYSDPADKARKAALQRAAKGFDAIYQTNRVDSQNRVSLAGLLAHMWHGKTMDELGDLQTALDIYDEVLANVPDPGQSQVSTGLEPLFAQVEYFRWLILSRRSSPRDFVVEASRWLTLYRNFKQTDGYQGIALEVAKAQLALAEKATGTEKTRLLSDGTSRLTAISKIRSQYQQEAILLRRKLLKTAADVTQVATFDEAVAVADAAAAAEQWADAAAGYTRALELADKVKDAGRMAAVRDQLDSAQLMLARDELSRGNLAECLRITEKLLHERPASPAAPSAGSLAVSAALNAYATVPGESRPAALQRLVDLANLIITTWPGKPEADDARMALGQAKLLTGRVDEALAMFQQVSPKSQRYPAALYQAGQTHWRRYLTEKMKPEGDRHQDQLAADRAKAVDLLTASLEAQRGTAETGQPLSGQLAETQLLLGEIALEGNRFPEAVALLQPLADPLRTTKPEDLDPTTLRVFMASIRACVATNDLEKAGQIGARLVEIGPDVPAVNAVLVEFAKLLSAQRKEALAEVTASAGASAAKPAEAAKAKLAAVENLLGTLLRKLAARQQHALAALVYLGDTFAAMGMDAEAKDQYQRILARAETDQQFAKTAAKAVTRVRAQLIGLLRKEGNHAEAMKQVLQLLKANPRALEPLMEQGRILQSWAEKDRSHYEEAVAHWSRLRNLLQPMKKRPPEYFEVTYNTAFCLHRQALQTADQQAAAQKAKQAEKLLKATLVLSPNLNGPDMVARYNALLQEVLALQKQPAGTAKKP